jgi:hypothetical protein
MTETVAEAPAIKYKFNEPVLQKEVSDYVAATYKQHYAKDDEDIQTFELIAQGNKLRGLWFAIGSILKYGDRYGYKDGFNRKDILKIIHFGFMALWAHDQAAKKELLK